MDVVVQKKNKGEQRYCAMLGSIIQGVAFPKSFNMCHLDGVEMDFASED